ncbi:uncharacterized protein LOC125676607 [Ostrea edulis]|uniref:uncharacterized protein LOC125676607 n=1 Tax=Ostrea edulis TaxID=37623 RepID=UPI0024AF5941|nr:uncharacterized protein LOC125676607 [Ostrea edulis]
MAGNQTSVCSEINLTCSVHCNDLLPLFCKDCDHLLCCDCVTRDHAGHKLCNVSEVVEFHQHELQGVLNNEKSIQILEKVVVDWQGEQNMLPMHTEDLLRNVIDREEEIITKVKNWRELMMDTIIKFREERDKYLKEKNSTISVLLNMNERCVQLELETCKLEITYINCVVQHLLGNTKKPSNFETSDLVDFEIGSTNGDLDDFFGKISERETSLDEITFVEANNVEEIGEIEDDEEEFYDCEDLQRYKFRTNSIKHIVPLQNFQALLLSSGTVYLCDFNKDNFDARIILSDVHQIANIPTSGDVLCVMKGFKEIKRISKGNVVTRFVYTTKNDQLFKSVSSGGNEAYACASQEDYENLSYTERIMYGVDDRKLNYFKVNLFNESGVILKAFDCGFVSVSDEWSLMKIREQNKCIRTKSNKVEMIDLQLRTQRKSYVGSVGINPASRFCTTGMTTDNESNILLAVQNDNAIHLLDKSLTFKTLLMTAEDGLYCPSSVALDRDGYLWVGCEDGWLHIVNYHYLLNTDRQTRLKLKHQAV